MSVLTRRLLLAGAATGLGLGALEAASLNRVFDFRSARATAKARYEAASKALDDPAAAEGTAIHIGHSTHLLSVAGVRAITDPWFFDPAFGALAHVAGPAVLAEDVGPLGCVLITHDHADHADPKALDRLDKRAVAVVATDDLAARLRRLGYREVLVLRAWESTSIGRATVTAVPGKHDIYEVGYVLSGAGRSIYFAGDTRLHEDLPAIAERLGPTMAILPVDGTRLRGDPLHVMTPDDAVEAARTLRVRAVMPSHADAELSDPFVEAFVATTIRGASALFGQAMARALPAVRCDVPAPGEAVPIPRQATTT